MFLRLFKARARIIKKTYVGRRKKAKGNKSLIKCRFGSEIEVEVNEIKEMNVYKCPEAPKVSKMKLRRKKEDVSDECLVHQGRATKRPV